MYVSLKVMMEIPKHKLQIESDWQDRRFTAIKTRQCIPHDVESQVNKINK
jgi:hypothetical protein